MYRHVVEVSSHESCLLLLQLRTVGYWCGLLKVIPVCNCVPTPPFADFLGKECSALHSWWVPLIYYICIYDT